MWRHKQCFPVPPMKSIPLLIAISLAASTAKAATTITYTELDQCHVEGSFVIDPADRTNIRLGPLLIEFKENSDVGRDVSVTAFWHDPWGGGSFNFGDAQLPRTRGSFTDYGHFDEYFLETHYVGQEVHGTLWFESDACDHVPESGPGFTGFAGLFALAGLARRFTRRQSSLIAPA